VVAAAFAVGAALTLLGHSASAAGGGVSVVSDVECDPLASGVLDITLVNETASDVTFMVTLAAASSPRAYVVAPSSAYAVTVTGLADGVGTVPISHGNVDATVSTTVDCATVQVASMGAASQLPETGSSTDGLLIGGAMVLAGVAASVVARRRVS